MSETLREAVVASARATLTRSLHRHTLAGTTGPTSDRRPPCRRNVPADDEYPPARVLAECEAKRRIVEDFTTLHADYQATHSEFTEARRFQALVSLGHLAEVYADHPDWREEWRP